MKSTDEQFMSAALQLAREAFDAGEVPVGAVVVRNGEVISTGRNRRESLTAFDLHAEIVALREACTVVGDWRLRDCDLYVTLEPCAMCAGALVASRIRRLVFGARDPRAGACGSLYNIAADPRLNHQCEVSRGVMADDSSDLLTKFFEAHRS